MKAKDILLLYKQLLRESKKFSAYNYREYAITRVQDGFRENKHLTNKIKINEAYKDALENLEVIKRQVVIGQLYATPPLVIEKQTTP